MNWAYPIEHTGTLNTMCCISLGLRAEELHDQMFTSCFFQLLELQYIWIDSCGFL